MDRCEIVTATFAGSEIKPTGLTGDRATGVFELRQYTMHPGQRDVLIDLFERELVDAQQAVGARVLGTFRDLDDPDRFVWLRGFADMATRSHALTTFYDGPTWNAHRGAANATMLDSDNVLLFRPEEGRRNPFDGFASESGSAGVYGVSLHYLGGVDVAAFAFFFRQMIALSHALRGLSLLQFATETSANNFPRLPIRENEPVFGWIARWSDLQAMEDTWHAVDRTAGWRETADSALFPALMRKPERLRLVPTGHSLMT